ncbi:hypothetical protein ACFLXH_04040 [Chloroflexota bacterium]
MLILSLAYFTAFFPHADDPYPLHLDEWEHLVWSQTLIEEGSTTFPNAFKESEIMKLGTDLYIGYHLFIGVLRSITGISTIDVVRYIPGVLFMLTILAVYIFGKREGFGLESALLTLLIPTSIGILGPAFMVPVAMSLGFIPLSMFLAFNFRTVWSYVIIAVFVVFLLLVHPPSAVCLVLILGPYALLNVKRNIHHTIGLVAALSSGFLITLPWSLPVAIDFGGRALEFTQLPTYVSLPPLFATYGYVPIGIALLGVFILAFKGDIKSYGLVLGMLLILLMLVSMFVSGYGIKILYFRGLMYLMLLIGIVAGAGLVWLSNVSLHESILKRVVFPTVWRRAGLILSLLLAVLTFSVAIPERLETKYYHMIDDIDYEAFTWINGNLDDDYGLAVLEPWKGTAFVAIARKRVLTRIGAYPVSIDQQVKRFLDGGCRDTAFLTDRGISIVYTRKSCDNPELIQVKENVYVLEIGSGSTEH